MARHVRFFAKTVLVKNNDIETAYRSLDRILSNDGVIRDFRLRQFYEKPYQKRNRLSYEKCKRVYNEEMKRKVAFVLRTNRIDPWLR